MRISDWSSDVCSSYLADIPVHIAHIKALGVDVHGQAGAVIAQIEKAQKAGQIVHADQYPWSASGTGLSAALLPRWAQDGGRAAMLKRFDDSSAMRSEEHTSELQSLMRISYAVFCL